MRGITRGLLFAALAVALTACSSARDNTTTAGMASSTSLESSDIAGIVLTANQGEIEQANAALPHLTNGAAQNFANMMIADHTSALNDARSVFSSSGINARDTSGMVTSLRNDSNQIVSSLKSASGSADRMYMQSQVSVHQNLLNTLDQQLIPASRGDLMELLQRQRAAVVTHLDRARAILANLP